MTPLSLELCASALSEAVFMVASGRALIREWEAGEYIKG